VPAFKTPQGAAIFLAAYDEAMKSWPVAYESREIQSRFGTTHVVVSGPVDGPPLVLLHGYWSTLTMWTPNVADLSRDHRVYAIDVIGQPGRSIPGEPMRNPADCAAWLTATLNGLRLDRVTLIGMSYGGWLALNYAIASPERLRNLVLLSPAASFLPLVRQFSLRGMRMVFLPTRLTVNSFMRWLGFGDALEGSSTVPELMYLGMKHFRIPRETAAVAPTVFSDADLRAMHVPTLLLIGEREVIFDPPSGLARARRLLPNIQGELLPRSSHEMCVSQHALVDRRILDFLERTQARRHTPVPECVGA
jgi:pimeloyl-ACP methyl ester carboxylesterase